MSNLNQTYRTYQVTIRTRRKKMPEAILKALIAAGLVKPKVDGATIMEVGSTATWTMFPLAGGNQGPSRVFTVENEV